MTTTEQFISTGSLLTQGLRPGMSRGMSVISGTAFNGVEPQLIFVNYDPSGVLPSLTGSDICFDVGTGSFLIAFDGVNGLDWRALRTM